MYATCGPGQTLGSVPGQLCCAVVIKDVLDGSNILWEIVCHHYLRQKIMISDARTMMFFLVFIRGASAAKVRKAAWAAINCMCCMRPRLTVCGRPSSPDSTCVPPAHLAAHMAARLRCRKHRLCPVPPVVRLPPAQHARRLLLPHLCFFFVLL